MSVAALRSSITAARQDGEIDKGDEYAIARAAGSNVSRAEAKLISDVLSDVAAGKLRADAPTVLALQERATPTPASKRLADGARAFASLTLLPYNLIHKMAVDKGTGSATTLVSGVGANLLLFPLTVVAGSVYGVVALARD